MNRIPPSLQELEDNKSDVSSWERDELAYKNMWNFNLPDASYGSLVFNIQNGIIGSEMKSYGLNFSYRRQQQQQQSSPAPSSIHSGSISNNTPEKPNQQDTPDSTPTNTNNNSYNSNRNSKRQSMVKMNK